MSKAKTETDQSNVPLEALLLECKKDRYKLTYSAIRWAKEIKQKENLPDPIPVLVIRAMREILTGKVSMKEIEKLPMMVKVAPQAAPAAPTLTLNIASEEK